MGQNFDTDAINTFISYIKKKKKKPRENPNLFSKCKFALLSEKLSCAEIQSLGLKYFVVFRSIYFATWKALDCVCVCGFFPYYSLGFQRFFLLSHNSREIAGTALPNILERP